MNHVYLSFPTLESTNDYLKDRYSTLENGTVIIAKHQTRGKGRLGRSWKDDEGSLLFSILLKGEEFKPLLSTISLLAGVSIEKTLLEEGIEAKIKWPNDIYLNDKKCCGILVEAISDSKLQALVVGVGLNLNNDHFPSELDSATSLKLETNRNFEKKAILNQFLKHFDEFIVSEMKGEEAYYPLLKEHDYLKGKSILLNYYGENKTVTALGITKNGALSVKDKDGKIITVTAGEATIVKSDPLH